MEEILGIGVATAMLINKAIDYFGYKHSSQYKAQQERNARLEELQKQQQRENQMFQLARDLQNQEFQRQRDAEQRYFQMEMEASRMAFQERIELRRLQVQQQLEQRREELSIALNERNIRNSQEIARFNAVAMRETQILVARENAQNLLQDHMVQDALRNFPLNISPLVLLKNRPHSLLSLLRFTIGEDCNINDVVKDIDDYTQNPEPLNVFVAPIYIDSKIKNREILSKQIWDTTYQRLESFFTEHYNRRSKQPVIFYPTAWNDKYIPGMHASETLHFFLKDMPCIVLEPRFDGNNFRIMISSWGLGYSSIEHYRTELNFELNIDAVLAYSVYERSKKALKVISNLNNADIADNEKTPFAMQQKILERNIKLYESLHIEERIKEGKMNEIDALGIYNIFKIEPVQDLALLSDTLSAQIGMTLASLTDIHHLQSTHEMPLFPMLMKKYFPLLFKNEALRRNLSNSYSNVILSLSNDENMLSTKEQNILHNIRIGQIETIKRQLELKTDADVQTDLKAFIRGIARNSFGFENENFELVWETCLEKMSEKEKPLFEMKYDEIEKHDSKMARQLRKAFIKFEKK